MLGKLIVDIAGTELNQIEKKYLSHDLIGGVILFTRNFENKNQLHNLCKSIKAIKDEEIIIFVDYEGGRIQRFRDGFTKLPSMSLLGKRYDSSPEEAKTFSKMVGNIIAYELGTLNIDLSFTPVLDLDYGKSKVISDRSFHHSHKVVSSLSLELIKGLDEMGFKNVAKHFPGHGFVEADSHIDLPIDNRKIDQNLMDLKPYIKNINKIDAVMTAHIIYKSVDANPVCYSDYWINSILRKSLNFKGLIISDDLLMKGADIGKSVHQRVIDCLETGCDLALVCNFYDEIPNLLNELEKFDSKIFQNSRISELRKGKEFSKNEKEIYEVAKLNIESNFK